MEKRERSRSSDSGRRSDGDPSGNPEFEGSPNSSGFIDLALACLPQRRQEFGTIMLVRFYGLWGNLFEPPSK